MSTLSPSSWPSSRYAKNKKKFENGTEIMQWEWNWAILIPHPEAGSKDIHEVEQNEPHLLGKC